MYYPDDDSEILETFPDGKSLGAKAATDVNQAAVPAKHGSRGEQPLRPQTSGQQCGEDRAVGPVHAWSGMGAAQHGNLLPQHEELKVFGCR
jgi:hypothetical protein